MYRGSEWDYYSPLDDRIPIYGDPYMNPGYNYPQQYNGQMPMYRQKMQFDRSNAKMTKKERQNHSLGGELAEQNGYALKALFEQMVEYEKNARILREEELMTSGVCEKFIENMDIDTGTYDSPLAIERMYGLNARLVLENSRLTIKMGTDTVKVIGTITTPLVVVTVNDLVVSIPHVYKNKHGEEGVMIRFKNYADMQFSKDDIAESKLILTADEYDFLIYKLQLILRDEIGDKYSEFGNSPMDYWFEKKKLALTPEVSVVVVSDIPLYGISDYLEKGYTSQTDDHIYAFSVTFTTFTEAEYPEHPNINAMVQESNDRIYNFALVPVASQLDYDYLAIHPERFLHILPGVIYSEKTQKQKQRMVKAVRKALPGKKLDEYLRKNRVLDMDAFIPFYNVERNELKIPASHFGETTKGEVIPTLGTLPKAFSVFIEGYLPEDPKARSLILDHIYKNTRIQELSKILMEKKKFLLIYLRGNEDYDTIQEAKKEHVTIFEIDNIDTYAETIVKEAKINTYYGLLSSSLDVSISNKGDKFVKVKKIEQEESGLFSTSGVKAKNRQPIDAAKIEQEIKTISLTQENIIYAQHLLDLSKQDLTDEDRDEIVLDAYKKDLIRANIFINKKKSKIYMDVPTVQEQGAIFYDPVLEDELSSYISRYLAGFLFYSSDYTYESGYNKITDVFIRDFLSPWLYETFQGSLYGKRRSVYDTRSKSVISGFIENIFDYNVFQELKLNELEARGKKDELDAYVKTSIEKILTRGMRFGTKSTLGVQFDPEDVSLFPFLDASLVGKSIYKAIDILYLLQERVRDGRKSMKATGIHRMLRLLVISCPKYESAYVAGGDGYVNEVVSIPEIAKALTVTFRTTTVPLSVPDATVLEALADMCIAVLSIYVLSDKKLIKNLKGYFNQYIAGRAVRLRKEQSRWQREAVNTYNGNIENTKMNETEKTIANKAILSRLRERTKETKAETERLFIYLLSYVYYAEVLEIFVDAFTGYYSVAYYREFKRSDNDMDVKIIITESRQKEDESARIDREFTHLYDATADVYYVMINNLFQLQLKGDMSIKRLDVLIMFVTDRFMFGIRQYLMLLTQQEKKKKKSPFETESLTHSLMMMIRETLGIYSLITFEYKKMNSIETLALYDFAKINGRTVLVYAVNNMLNAISTKSGKVSRHEVHTQEIYDKFLHDILEFNPEIVMGDNLTQLIVNVLSDQKMYIAEQMKILNAENEENVGKISDELSKLYEKMDLKATLECEAPILNVDPKQVKPKDVMTVQRQFGASSIRETNFTIAIDNPSREDGIYNIGRDTGKRIVYEDRVFFQYVEGKQIRYESPNSTKFHITIPVNTLNIRRDAFELMYTQEMEKTEGSDFVEGYPLFYSPNIISIGSGVSDIIKLSNKTILAEGDMLQFRALVTIEFSVVASSELVDALVNTTGEQAIVLGSVKFLYLLSLDDTYVQRLLSGMGSEFVSNFIKQYTITRPTGEKAIREKIDQNELILKQRFRQKMLEEKENL